MGKTIKVLIVDDSRMVRDILKDIFKEDKELEVIGEACNGKEAITLTRELMPDIVTMDIQMPEMDGFEATEHIMAYSPTPILILSSAIDKSEQYTGFKAISLGALDNMSKPDITQEGFNDIAGTLVKRVKMLSRIKVIPHIRGKLKSHHIHKKVQPLTENTEPSPGPDEQELLDQEAGNDARDVKELLRKTNATAVNVSKKRSKIKVIAIGASTGGPMALEKILSLFPADFPSGIVVVQHMAKGFIESFADWLGTKTPLKIKIGEDGEAIKNGTVYFAPDDVQLEINPDCTLRLNKHAPFWGEFKPSVNNLFKSVGENLGCKSIGVILTGMGSDGAEGMTTLYKKGAYTIAQNQETSLIFGMPKASIENRCISSVLPLRDIPDAIALKMTE